MFSFMTAIKKEVTYGETNESRTENGALGYRTTGKELLDINFKIPQLRNMSDSELADSWYATYFENPKYAIRWLFYLRDVRGGIGERATFRRILKIMANDEKFSKLVIALISAKVNDEYLIPFYGRWDDLIELFKIPNVQSYVSKVISYQKYIDQVNMTNSKSISLLATHLRMF